MKPGNRVWNLIPSHPQHWSCLCPNIPYLCRVAIRLSCCCLAALMHGWRWRGRRREALSTDSGDLKQRNGRVEVHGDLRRHGVRRCGLQADRQGSSRTLHGVVMEDVQLRRNHVHDGHRSVARDGLGRGVGFSWVWRTRETRLRTYQEEQACFS